MNAPIANQEAGTPKTPSTDTAPRAASTTPPRIDKFIERQLAKVKSADFSGIRSTASRAAALGFTSSANSRYVEFLEGFHTTPALAAHYADRYPLCCFLPWEAFHATLKALQLWCELPEFYAGAIPDSELTMLELFPGVDPDDAPRPADVARMLPELLPVFRERLEVVVRSLSRSGDNPYRTYEGRGRYDGTASEWQREIIVRGRMVGPVHRFWSEASDSFFVVAPPEAFTSNEDWLSRFRRLMPDVETDPTTPPDDPLVVRFVNGGVLVVASWGDEGAWLNNAVKELEGGAA